MPQPLSDSDRAALQQIIETGSFKDAQRARIILLAHDLTTPAEVASAVSGTTRQVQYWVNAWVKRGLSIFPGVDLTEKAVTDPDMVPVDSKNGSGGDDETAVPMTRPGIDVPRLPLELAERIGVLPDDPMSEAGRKVLLFHFERMLQHEPGSRQGTDIEAVHDMRVATRRMRSALRTFGPFFESKSMERYGKHLKRMGRALGTVRDLEVLLTNARNFGVTHPDQDLSPLLDEWQASLDDARLDLIDKLDGKKFARFVEDFHAFLTTPGRDALPFPEPGSGEAYQVRHIAPRLIYELYERVRSYETALDDAPLPTLHALRIEFKRFRYALEAFENVLGSEAKRVIKEVKLMQDVLGDLNDANVAHLLLRQYIDNHHTSYSGTPGFMRPPMEGVYGYSRFVEGEMDRLRAAFPAAWKAFLRDEVRRDLALAVAVL